MTIQRHRTGREACCVVCGGAMEIPDVRPSSGVWSHSDPQKCITVLRAQRETLHSENAAWRKRAEQAEAEVRSLASRGTPDPGAKP